MRQFSRWFQTVMVMGACALGLVHCGVEGNPFYALSASSVANDVPDGATLDDVPDGSDVIQDEAILADVSFVDQLDVSDGNVADDVDGAISNSDAVDASDVEDGAVDIVLVFPDLVTPDVVTPTPDMVAADDVVDATVAMDVIMTPDIVTVPDTALMPDVVPAVDVVDASAPIDRPDVPPVMDVVMTPDVAVMSDRPDVVSLPDVVDAPPAVDIVDVVTPPDVPLVPDFVVEYHMQEGENNIPFGLVPITSIGVSFFVDGQWLRTDLAVLRDPDRSYYFSAAIPALASLQRRATALALALPNEGCGIRASRVCPNDWYLHWEVRWFGRFYSGRDSVSLPDGGSVRAFSLGNQVACSIQGFADTGCVHFVTP